MKVQIDPAHRKSAFEYVELLDESKITDSEKKSCLDSLELADGTNYLYLFGMYIHTNICDAVRIYEIMHAKYLNNLWLENLEKSHNAGLGILQQTQK